MLKRNSHNNEPLTSISSHAIMRVRQRFKLKKKKEAIRKLKDAIKKGEVINDMGFMNCDMKYNDMYLIVRNNVVTTVFNEKMYDNSSDQINEEQMMGMALAEGIEDYNNGYKRNR